MTKKAVVFDLDGTLAPSKSALPDLMAKQLRELLQHKEVCVISGGKFTQFELQLMNNLHADTELLHKLHIMPTCGTRYLRYDSVEHKWVERYAEDIDKKDRKRIIDALNIAAKKLGYKEDKVYGDVVEDRGSQITFSALGQDIVAELGQKGVEIKEAWDPTDKKKLKLRDEVAALIPDFEVRAGGATSIDVTRPGIDKAYGVEKLKEELSLSNEEILFIGDKLEEGGNDYPVKAMGIDSIAVENWEQTSLIVETINKSQ